MIVRRPAGNVGKCDRRRIERPARAYAGGAKLPLPQSTAHDRATIVTPQ
jgi:hypothetical protein